MSQQDEPYVIRIHRQPVIDPLKRLQLDKKEETKKEE
jgi:hypothetical protein